MTVYADVSPTHFADGYYSTCHSERSEESPVFAIVRVAYGLCRRTCARTHLVHGGFLRMTDRGAVTFRV